ncbi:MAG: hypothetical protein R2851_09580 [Caldilineaceae bacterium]
MAHDGVVQYSSAAPDGDVWQDFAQCLFTRPAATTARKRFRNLSAAGCAGRGRNREGNRLFYLSTPPSVFEPVTTLINTTGSSRRAKKAAGCA